MVFVVLLFCCLWLLFVCFCTNIKWGLATSNDDNIDNEYRINIIESILKLNDFDGINQRKIKNCNYGSAQV